MKMRKRKEINPAAKTRQELADELGISYTTLYRWLKKFEIELPAGLITPHHIEKIYECFGFPLPEEYEEQKKGSTD